MMKPNFLFEGGLVRRLDFAIITLLILLLASMPISGQIYPRRQNRDLYRFYYEQYVKSYWQLRDLMHKVSTRLETTPRG